MSEMSHTFPPSVQPGIPRLGPTPPGWSRVRLGKLFDVESRPVRMSNDAEYDLITIKRSRGGIERRSRMKGREISVKSQFEIREGDFVISKRQIVHGACAIVPAEFSGSIVSNEYSVLRCRPALDLEYLRWLVHSLYIQQTFFHSSIGVHVEKMIFRLDEWFRWQIDLPPVDMQRRRAANMNAVHARLEGLQREKSLLEDYKTGLMQRIFARDLRFRADDGSAFPDWEYLPFGSLFDWISTNSLSREWASEPFGQIQNIHYGDIHGKLGPVIHQDIANLPFIAAGAPMRALRDEEYCRPGDVVIADASEDYADVGKVSEIVSCRERSMVAGLHTFLARPTSPRIVRGYAGFALRSWPMRKAIMRIAQGISVLGISKGEFGKLLMPVPHPDEQRKIADTLGAIDMKIEAMAAQINQLETFKRGLLQKMFV
jgi:type I restriction enzyme S subunit